MSLANKKEKCFLIETLKSHIPNVEELLNPAVEESEINLFEHDELQISRRFQKVIHEF